MASEFSDDAVVPDGLAAKAASAKDDDPTEPMFITKGQVVIDIIRERILKFGTALYAKPGPGGRYLFFQSFRRASKPAASTKLSRNALDRDSQPNISDGSPSVLSFSAPKLGRERHHPYVFQETLRTLLCQTPKPTIEKAVRTACDFINDVVPTARALRNAGSGSFLGTQSLMAGFVQDD